VEALGGDEQADRRLAETGRETDECVFVGRGVRELELVAAPLKEVVDEQGLSMPVASVAIGGASPPSA